MFVCLASNYDMFDINAATPPPIGHKRGEVVPDSHCSEMKQRQAMLIMERLAPWVFGCLGSSTAMVCFVKGKNALSGNSGIRNLGVHKTFWVTRGIPAPSTNECKEVIEAP